MLSVLTVNIGAAAVSRAEAMLDWLAGRDEDVFILTETSNGAGTAYLCNRFSQAGWSVQHQPDVGGDRGAALLSKVELLRSGIDYFADMSIPGRLVTAMLDTEPRVTVVGTYVPSRDRSAGKTEKKQRFIGSLLSALDAVPADARGSMVIGGDYNVIARDHTPLYAGFLPFEFGLLESLDGYGFVDVHALLSPEVQAYSWIGRTGDGYRYDYFHVGKALTDRIGTGTYIHETRERKLTDHAAVSMSLAVDRVNRRQVSDLTTPDEQAALF